MPRQTQTVSNNVFHASFLLSQDFRPNEDHLSNMRSALQYMLVQHSDTNSSVFLLPSWPCGNWSVSFKLHAPQRTTLEGEYNHTTGSLRLHVEPVARQADVHVLGCGKNVVFGPP